MTREIKFRAYDKKNKIMWNEGVYISLDGDLSFDGMKMVTGYNPFEFELMQFTGLKDKNGKEIYEGDIYHMGATNIKYVVIWHDSGLIGKQVSSSSFAGISHWKDRIEVIGNIHENPELLNKETGL